MFSSRRLRASLFSVSAALLLSACQTLQPQPEPVVTPVIVISEHEKRHTAEQARMIFSAYDDWLLEQSPVLSSRLGITGQFDWDDISTEAQDRRLEALQGYRSQLKELNESALSGQTLASYRTLLNDIEYQLLLAPLRIQQSAFSDQHGWHIEVADILLNHHPVHSIQDAHDYISRLAALPVLMQRWREELVNRASAGHLPPAFVFDAVIGQIQQLQGLSADKGSEPSLLATDFNHKLAALQLYPSTHKVITRKFNRVMRKNVKPSLTSFVTLLQEQREQAPQTPVLKSNSEGMRFYQLQLQRYAQTNQDANSLFQFGLSEVSRLQQELLSMATPLAFPVTNKEQKIHLTDLINWQKKHSKPFANDRLGDHEVIGLERTTLEKINQRLPYFFTQLPQKALVVTDNQPTTHSEINPFSNRSDYQRKGCWYTPGHSQQPAHFVIDVKNAKEMTRSDLINDVYSCSAPGAHLHIALSQENTELPLFRRSPFVSRFNRGWELYAQQLALQMTENPTPQQRFAVTSSMLAHAAAIVVDSGLHVKGWSRLQTLDYLRENTALSLSEAQHMIKTSLLYPGQQLESYMGFQHIQTAHQNIKSKIEQALGEKKFDQAAFHTHLLKAGAIPFDVLNRLLNEWADQTISEEKERIKNQKNSSLASNNE